VMPIVVADLNMPGMDGLELCRRIREHTWPGYIYVVLLTIRDEEKDILAGFEAGADDYLSKRTPAVQFKARLRTAKRILELEYSLKSIADRQRQLAMTDALTETFNRRYFEQHLGRELKRVRRFGGNVSLLLLDIDNFKWVNDAMGHAAGDLVLKELTTVIGKCCQRATDWSARIGGDEFAVVLEGTTLAEARDCAERLRKAISNNTTRTAMGAIRVTASIGISGFEAFADPGAATVETLLELADMNLYASKNRGRNCVTLSNSSRTRVKIVQAVGR